MEVRWYSEFQAGPILYKPQCRSRRVLPMSATRVCFTGTCPRASPGGTGSLNRRNRQIKRGNFARAPTTTTAHGIAEWLFANGGECSAVRAGVSSRGRGLFAVRDVRTGESIVRIPLKACITDFLHPIPIHALPEGLDNLRRVLAVPILLILAHPRQPSYELAEGNMTSQERHAPKGSLCRGWEGLHAGTPPGC